MLFHCRCISSHRYQWRIVRSTNGWRPWNRKCAWRWRSCWLKPWRTLQTFVLQRLTSRHSCCGSTNTRRSLWFLPVRSGEKYLEWHISHWNCSDLPLMSVIFYHFFFISSNNEMRYQGQFWHRYSSLDHLVHVKQHHQPWSLDQVNWLGPQSAFFWAIIISITIWLISCYLLSCFVAKSTVWDNLPIDIWEKGVASKFFRWLLEAFLFSQALFSLLHHLWALILILSLATVGVIWFSTLGKEFTRLSCAKGCVWQLLLWPYTDV